MEETQIRINDDVNLDPSRTTAYSRGSYNKFNETEQWIRISEGCPNACPYCRETKECGKEPIYFEVPEIVRNDVKIMDMNLLYKPRALEILNDLGSKRVNGKVVYYELVCGIDYRYLTPELAEALHRNRFKNIRLAWDWGFKFQKEIKKSVELLIKSGYNSRDITIFMICNWKIPYEENKLKLDLCKIWRVKVADCWFDNQLSPNILPVMWLPMQILAFRHSVRKHNQMVNFGIDPEYKSENFA